MDYYNMKKIINDKDFENLKKIVENDKAVGKQNNGVKILIYSLFICIINKYRKCDGNTVFVVNGKAELKFSKQSDATSLYYAVVSKKLGDYYKLRTHVSYISRRFRAKLLFFSITHKVKNIPRGYLLDYLLWKAFFKVYDAERIGGSGHYDRLTTQLAFLASDNNKRYYMKQHGLLGHNMKLPHKFPVDMIVAYDAVEIEKFRKEITLNEDCVFVAEYNSTVEFEYTQKKEMNIGIIDTPIDEMPKLLEMILASKYDGKYTIMLHPLSRISVNDYKCENIQFLKEKKKELNYDMIFSGPSTLVYDYVKAGYDKPIIVYVMDRTSGLCDVSLCYENVKICYSLSEFQEICMDLSV